MQPVSREAPERAIRVDRQLTWCISRERETAAAQKAADDRARLAAMSGHEREAVDVLAQMGRPATTARSPILQQDVGSLADALSVSF